MLTDFTSYLKLVARSHLRQPGFALVIIFTLALGLGAAVATLAVVINLLFNPLPFRDADELVAVVSAQPARQATRLSVSYPDFKDWQRLNQVFSEMAAVSNMRPVTWTGGDQAVHLQAEFVSWNYFPMLGVGASLGRTFDAEEDLSPGSHPVAVISHRLWQQRFAGESVEGREILLNGLVHQIIGVLEPTYQGLWWDEIDLWLPMAMAPSFLGDDYRESRSMHWHLTLARLKPGVSVEQARQGMNALAEELEKRFPVSNSGYRTSVFAQRELYYSTEEESLWKALIFTGIFLALCCLNISALMLTRGTARRREVAVRSALGASRFRLLAEQIGESVLLTSIGGVLGLVIALLGAKAMLRFSQLSPVSFQLSFFDARIFAATFGLVLLAAVLIALGPVLQTLWSDLWRFLKQGAATTGSRRFRGLLNGMIVLEVALATLVLVSAVVTYQSFVELGRSQIGMDSDQLLTARVDLQEAQYQESANLYRRQLEILDTVKALPGVSATGLVGPYGPPQAILYTDATFEDRLEESAESASLRVYRQYVSPGYHQAVGIPLVEGRELNRQDAADRPLVVIVSGALANVVWPGESALGKRLRRGLPDSQDYPWLTVVGVARTTANRGPKDIGKGPDYDLYLPLLQDPKASIMLVVRATEGSDPAELSGLVREAVHGLDSNIPVYQVATMPEKLNELAKTEQFLALVMGLFGALAAVVAAIGLYGVIAYGVRRRMREFGVRIALGAAPRRILGLVIYPGMVLIGVGIALGLAVALFLRDKLPGVQVASDVIDPLALVMPILVLLVIGLIGMVVPARRAVRVEPTKVLQQE